MYIDNQKFLRNWMEYFNLLEDNFWTVKEHNSVTTMYEDLASLAVRNGAKMEDSRVPLADETTYALFKFKWILSVWFVHEF